MSIVRDSHGVEDVAFGSSSCQEDSDGKSLFMLMNVPRTDHPTAHISTIQASPPPVTTPWTHNSRRAELLLAGRNGEKAGVDRPGIREKKSVYS